MGDLFLEIIEGSQAGRRVPLTGSLEVGRDPGLSLSIDDGQTSRRHARIDVSPEGAVIQDLASANGTYVNDEPVQGSRRLRPGDRVRLGLTVLELRTREQVAAAPSAVMRIPPVTTVDAAVLRPVSEDLLPSATPVNQGASSFMVEASEPAFVPPQVLGDDDAESDYRALAALVDARVKKQTSIAAFAFLSLAGLAVAIFFGVR